MFLDKQGGKTYSDNNVSGENAFMREKQPRERNAIRHLMLFSDLENLLSVWRICYQLGESYLNVFLLHDIENL